MKKIYLFLILMVFFIPIRVNATETYIDNYYINMTVEENGNVNVKELFVYKGIFNGAYKTIDLNNTSTEDLFIDANLYNPTGINLIAVKSITVDNNVNFDYIYKTGTVFTYNSLATSGDTGYYLLEKTNNTYTYKIFNPGTREGFYIEYELENVVVTHNDVSELWLNVFKTIPDNINYVEIRLNIPGNNNELRAWAHGPLTGDIDIKSKNLVYFTVEDGLYTGDTLDIRIAFDKINSVKKSGVDGLSQIIEYETVLAEKANAKRNKLNIVGIIISIIGFAWVLYLIYFIRKVYKSNDKEYDSLFKKKYFRDIPSDVNPACVDYLVAQKVSTNDLSANILNLIYKKNIDFVKLNKKNYKFILKNKNNLDEIEEEVIQVLFNGKQEEDLEEFKKQAKKDYVKFLKRYNEWYKVSLAKSKEKEYFINNSKVKIKGALHIFITLILFIVEAYFFSQGYNVYSISAVLQLIFFCILIVYFARLTKRTQSANDEYYKWIGLKKFMKDFSRMDEKELPEVRLWDKYLVYATTLGCADRLIKNMQIKIKDLPNANTNFYNHNLIDLMIINNIINQTVTTSVVAARNIAASHQSSGSGFGGGFSGGGGFGGGGGGSTGHF